MLLLLGAAAQRADEAPPVTRRLPAESARHRSSTTPPTRRPAASAARPADAVRGGTTALAAPPAPAAAASDVDGPSWLASVGRARRRVRLADQGGVLASWHVTADAIAPCDAPAYCGCGSGPALRGAASARAGRPPPEWPTRGRTPPGSCARRRRARPRRPPARRRRRRARPPAASGGRAEEGSGPRSSRARVDDIKTAEAAATAAICAMREFEKIVGKFDASSRTRRESCATGPQLWEQMAVTKQNVEQARKQAAARSERSDGGVGGARQRPRRLYDGGACAGFRRVRARARAARNRRARLGPSNRAARSATGLRRGTSLTVTPTRADSAATLGAGREEHRFFLMGLALPGAAGTRRSKLVKTRCSTVAPTRRNFLKPECEHVGGEQPTWGIQPSSEEDDDAAQADDCCMVGGDWWAKWDHASANWYFVQAATGQSQWETCEGVDPSLLPPGVALSYDERADDRRRDAGARAAAHGLSRGHALAGRALRLDSDQA